MPFEEQRLELSGGHEFILRYLADPVSLDSAAGQAAVATHLVSNTTAVPDVPRIADPAASTAATERHSSAAGASSMIFVILAVAILLAAAYFGVRHVVGTSRIRSRTTAHLQIVSEETTEVRKRVREDLYEQIRSRISSSEMARLEDEIRGMVCSDLEKALMATEGKAIREELENELREKVRTGLVEEIRADLLAGEESALREKARAALVSEAAERLRGEVGGQLEMEALQALTCAIQGEIKAENGASLKERLLHDFKERMAQELAIKERSAVQASVRAALREKIEIEVLEKEGEALNREARDGLLNGFRRELETAGTAALSSPAVGGSKETVESVIQDLRSVMRNLDNSEALSSLATTVDLLRSSQRDTPWFTLNAGQTAGMVEYLGNLSGRLQGYIADVKSGLGRLFRGVEAMERRQPPSDVNQIDAPSAVLENEPIPIRDEAETAGSWAAEASPRPQSEVQEPA